jgi:hypothetical protein
MLSESDIKTFCLLLCCLATGLRNAARNPVGKSDRSMDVLVLLCLFYI